MAWIGIIVVVIAVLAILSDRRSKALARFKDATAESEMLNADELGPSHTGKYKVQQMLKKTESWKIDGQGVDTTSSPTSGEDEQEL